jgi:hypothetical protein
MVKLNSYKNFYFLNKIKLNKLIKHDEGLVEKLARFFSCGNQILL